MVEISIIVPVYQVQQYLNRCVESIVCQTFMDFELILVDDGSTDHCPDLCDQWAKKDKRVRVVHKENGGASSARNAGLDIAQGQYIGFVDADDWITPDFYEYLHLLIKQFHADIVMCDYTRAPRNLELGMDMQCIRELDTHAMQELFYRIHGEPSRYSVCNCLYKAELLKKVRFIEGFTTEDVLFTYETYKSAKKLVFSKRKKYLYFENSVGVTRSKLCAKDLGLLKIWDQIIQLERGTSYSEYAKLNRMRATFTLYGKALLCGCDVNFDQAVLKEWRTELRRNFKYLLKGKILDIRRKMLLLWIIAIG